MLMKANIQAVSLKIQTLRSQNAMAQAMKGVTKAMQNMNRQVNYHYNIFYKLMFKFKISLVLC
jgi:division protein CdvB (Snf7/Vps24/ESCRT-III family)